MEVAHTPFAESAQNGETVSTGLAWAAGFLDGEGCIHIAKQQYKGRRAATYRLGVYVTQNDLAALEAFREAVGLSAPIHPTKRAANHRRQCYVLCYSGHSALELLKRLRSFLRRKGREADAAIQFWREGRIGVPGNGQRTSSEVVATREHFYQLLKKLK